VARTSGRVAEYRIVRGETAAGGAGSGSSRRSGTSARTWHRRAAGTRSTFAPWPSGWVRAIG